MVSLEGTRGDAHNNFNKQKGFNVFMSLQEYLSASYSFTGGQL